MSDSSPNPAGTDIGEAYQTCTYLIQILQVYLLRYLAVSYVFTTVDCENLKALWFTKDDIYPQKDFRGFPYKVYNCVYHIFKKVCSHLKIYECARIK